MSGVDVGDLAREELPDGRFPAELRAPFRLHLASAVRHGIEAHAKADPTVEICGVLVGHWQRDANGPFATVTDFIRCDSASSKYAEVTFTHESWAEINREMDTRFADKRIVGWYHSHPDFGIFLSDRDAFIHQHFFSGPGQVAYVIDPVRDLEGAFTWQHGKPTPLAHFWVGDQIRTVEASLRNPTREAAAAASSRGSDQSAAGAGGLDLRAHEPSALPLATTLLSCLALFLLGYFYAGWRTDWEREKIVEGAVAHYGIDKVMTIGLDQNLAKVRQTLRGIEAELRKLPNAGDELSAKDASQANEQRRLIGDSLLVTGEALEQIQTKYALSAEERAVLAQMVAERVAALRQLTPAAPKPKAKITQPAPTPTADSLKPPAKSPPPEQKPARPPAAAPANRADPAD